MNKSHSGGFEDVYSVVVVLLANTISSTILTRLQGRYSLHIPATITSVTCQIK